VCKTLDANPAVVDTCKYIGEVRSAVTDEKARLLGLLAGGGGSLGAGSPHLDAQPGTLRTLSRQANQIGQMANQGSAASSVQQREVGLGFLGAGRA
jgi:hypothetical protein